uniref:Uncharacterized protein n=1 Tax=Pithovirus LCPAC403 TaxID=2506596 RepID=A0A481ZE72_9VIRU|nr:MAG: hypothetical protein LCPAC403_00750 [Pithovirus LCPAC403]
MNSEDSTSRDLKMKILANIDETFRIYIKYLEDSKKRYNTFFDDPWDMQWNVVFNYGSVVTLDLSDEFFKVGDEKEERIWNNQKEPINSQGKALVIALKRLIDNGHPPTEYPPDDVSLLIYEGETKLYSTKWSYQGASIYNLILEVDEKKAKHSGGNLRRSDCTYPKVYAIISPDLVIFKL